MSQKRFVLHAEEGAVWTVFDTQDKTVARARDRVLAGLTMEEASDAANLLNIVEDLRCGRQRSIGMLHHRLMSHLNIS